MGAFGVAAILQPPPLELCLAIEESGASLLPLAFLPEEPPEPEEPLPPLLLALADWPPLEAGVLPPLLLELEDEPPPFPPDLLLDDVPPLDPAPPELPALLEETGVSLVLEPPLPPDELLPPVPPDTVPPEPACELELELERVPPAPAVPPPLGQGERPSQSYFRPCGSSLLRSMDGHTSWPDFWPLALSQWPSSSEPRSSH